MNEVTRILSAVEGGEPQAAERLLPLVYDELRRLAARGSPVRQPGQTLQATALVHEAYLRLVDTATSPALGRPRPLLRRRGRGHAPHPGRAGTPAGRLRHGGGLRRLGDLDGEVAVDPRDDEQILLLDEALTRLAAVRPQAAELVKLRFFSGLTAEEAAPLVGLSPRSRPATLGLRPRLAAAGYGAFGRSRALKSSSGGKPRILGRFPGPASHCLVEQPESGHSRAGSCFDDRTIIAGRGDFRAGAGDRVRRRAGGVPRSGLRR